MSDRPARRRHHPTSITLRDVIRLGRLSRRSRDRWELWTLRKALLGYVLVVQVAALVVTVMMLVDQPISSGDGVMLGGLVLLGLAKEELTRHVERMRRWFSDTPHQNMTSVWTFAAALVLPPGLSAVVVVALYTYLWVRTWRPLRNVRPWKLVFSAATVVLSCHAATGVIEVAGSSALSTTADWRGMALIAVAILVYSIVNLGLVSAAIALMTSDRTARRLFGTIDDSLLEYATLAMGAVTAILLLQVPWAIVFVLPILVVLHRAVLIRQLEEAASTDPKTGLLNATAWRSLATTEFERARRDGTGIGIFMLDLDHFKYVNDTHGHLVGDAVLIEVAKHLKSTVREYDILARFGGEEFMVLCPELAADDLADVGERLRSAVGQVEVVIDDGAETIKPTVSVGAAHYPASGATLEDVLLAADIALFAAKDGGRNRVAIRRPRTTQQSPPYAPSSASS